MDWTRRAVMAAGGGAVVSACATNGGATPPPTRDVIGGVRAIAPGFSAVADSGAVVERLGQGYQWSEGPLWIREGRYLLFTDVPGNTMYKWAEGEGVTEFLKPSGFAGADASHLREGGANGLARGLDGALLMADTGNRGLARLDLRTMRKDIFLDRFEGKRFNSPNDLVVHSSGAIYFTDPPYGLAGMSDSPLREIPFHGVYRWTPSGQVQLVDDSLPFPNGVALSPDEGILYVACSGPQAIIKAYRLGADGMPEDAWQFFDAGPLRSDAAPGNPDGLAIDSDGRLYQSGPGGVLVIAPNAELLGVIDPGRRCANCKFGEDGHTLFLTAHESLARIRLKTKGVGF